MFECPYCGRTFTSKSGATNHINHCSNNPNRIVRKEYKKSSESSYNMVQSLYCKYCGKECHSLNSLTQHELRCSCNPSHICINNFSELYSSYSEETKKRMNWNKGLTKETHPSVMSYALKLRGRKGNMLGKTFVKTEESKRKQSETRRKRIAEGLITPVTCHRFTNAYIEFTDGRQKFLRSSYELIVAIFLDVCNETFDYEAVRAPYYDSKGNMHSFIGDFNIRNVVLEIKGFYDEEKLKEEAAAFKAIGYDLRVVYESEVMYIKSLLSQVMDIDKLLREVKQASKEKNYFVYKLKNS